MRPNKKGSTGALWYIDKTFTIAPTQDQFIATFQTNHHATKPMTQPNNTPQVPMRFLSVCSGMEAASVAWEPLGWKAVGFSEIEPFPCAILSTRYPNIKNYGSLTEYKQWPIEPGSIDLLVGGTPCQSFSVAGLRKGLADPRGNLALVFLGLADKLKPRWIVWENVPGVLSSNGGRDLGSFLGALVQLGYGFAYRVLDAQHFGVPQRRRRVFVVACLGDWRSPAEVLLESDCVRRDIKKGRAKGQATAADAGSGAETGLPRTVGTLCADAHPGAYSGQDAYTGRLIPSHWEGGDVHPTLNQSSKGCGSPGYSNQEIFSQKDGGLVPVPFRKSKRACSTTDNETWVEADASNTLNNFDLGDTRTTHAVVEPIAIQGTIIGRSETSGSEGLGATENGSMYTLIKTDIHGVLYENHPNDSRVTGPHDVAPTVVSRFGTGGGNVPLVNQEPKIIKASELRLTGKITEQDTCPTLLANTKSGDNDPLAVHAITFQPGNLRREAGADPSTTTTTTLKASAGDQMPHVCHPVVQLDGMNLLSRLGECGENHSMQNFTPGNPSFTLKKGGNQHGVLTPMAVRRLTPTECERLQGFPDNWSRIPWKGKPEDQCPDGPRYRACGNSMAVPVMCWIGEQIARVEAEGK